MNAADTENFNLIVLREICYFFVHVVALESMSEMLSNDEAWFPAYADLQVGTDQNRNIVYYVPRCVVEFMTLLSLMTSKLFITFESGVKYMDGISKMDQCFLNFLSLFVIRT